MTDTGARVLALSDLKQGDVTTVDFSIDDRQMQQFAELSGDFNPLHTDEAFARAKGFEGKVVYGALLVAKISQLIGMHLPGRDSVWASIALDFRKPLYVERAAQAEATVASVSDSTGLVELALRVRAEGVVLAKGRAEVILGR